MMELVTNPMVVGSIFNSFFYASLLFFAAVGLTLVFGVLNLMNMAHGAFFGLGAYLSIWLLENLGSISTSIAFLIASIVVAIPAVVFVLASALDKTVFAPLYDLEPTYQLLATFGILLMIEDIIKFIWGASPISLDSEVDPARQLGSAEVLGSTLTVYRGVVIVAGVATALGLYLMFKRTKLGKISQAMSEDYEMVEMLGINVGRVRLLIFGISIAVASLGGALFVPLVTAQPSLLLDYVLLSFAVIVIGGLGNLKGAVVASLLIGFVRSFSIAVYPAMELAVVFALMAIVITLRPEGLFGERGVAE